MKLKHFRIDEEDKKGIAGSTQNNFLRDIGFFQYHFGNSHGSDGNIVIGAGGKNPIKIGFDRNDNSPNKAAMSLGQYENAARVAAAAHVNGYNEVRIHGKIPKKPIKAVQVEAIDIPKNPPKPRQHTKPKDISLREFVIGLILVFILLRFFLTYVLFGIAVCFFLKVSVSDVISKVRKVLDR